jgi:hypothetical protein
LFGEQAVEAEGYAQALDVLGTHVRVGQIHLEWSTRGRVDQREDEN